MKTNSFTKRVAEFMSANNVKPGCFSPVSESGESFFSWSDCECCGSHLGGNRETYSFAMNSGETFTADICTDCVEHLANI